MIFVSVGTQLPFPRMMRVIDQWAEGEKELVIAQTAEVDVKYPNLECYPFLDAVSFLKYYNQAEIVVSHAGMGNIINALQSCKPIIIFPRDASLREHRNDHQKATAKKFENRKGVYVVNNQEELELTIKAIKSESLVNQDLESPVELEGFLVGLIDGWKNEKV